MLAKNARLSTPLQPLISADSLYARGVADHSLQPNRVISTSGELLGEGPRPGFPPLAQQIAQLRQELEVKNEVTLLDAGAFSGDSLLQIVELFGEKDIRVSKVLLGVEVLGATHTLREKGVDCRSVIKIKNPIDWIEARDFIPFTPLCGRVVGDEKGPIIINGLSFAVPYILPKGNPVEWASIPKERAKDLSRRCWEISLELFTNIEEINQSLSIRLEDIKKAPIRTSYPGFPPEELEMSTRILDIIKDQLSCLG